MHSCNNKPNNTAAKLQFYLHPDSAAYRQGIFDVIRIFDPMFEWGTEANDASMISVTCTDAQWILTVGTKQIAFETASLDENQCRRLLKIHLYHLLSGQSEDEHPWGIMTGIRPTKIIHRYWDEDLSKAEIKQKAMEEYFLKEEKADLLLDVTERQRPFLLSREEAKEQVSIYLSIPFCPTRCHYCSFPSFCLPKPQLQEQYLTNLLAECKAVGETLRQYGKQVQTVYIGGGTPTSLSAAQLERLLDGIYNSLGDSFEEFTVEAGRPDTITPEKLQTMHAYHVGRISINPQTFLQSTLDAIGRKHTVQDIIDVYHLARQIGFDSINMDLITGLPGETAKDFMQSLAYISDLKPENVTVHTLAIKRTAKLDRRDFHKQQADTVRDMHAVLQNWLEKEDYVPYYLYRQKQMIGDQENTGYCLPGKESLYNIQMMEERQTILGLGVGSTSKYVNTADWTLTQNNNPKDLYFYNERIDEIISKKRNCISQIF